MSVDKICIDLGSQTVTVVPSSISARADLAKPHIRVCVPNTHYWTGPAPKVVGSSSGGGLDQAQADARYVNVAGDRMTGPLTVPIPLTIEAQAVSPEKALSETGLIVAEAFVDELDPGRGTCLRITALGPNLGGDAGDDFYWSTYLEVDRRGVRVPEGVWWDDPDLSPFTLATKAYVDASAGSGGGDGSVAVPEGGSIDFATGNDTFRIAASGQGYADAVLDISARIGGPDNDFAPVLSVRAGRVYVPEPQEDGHAATKAYVDNAVAPLLARIAHLEELMGMEGMG